ncbi:MAG: hypothetical protein NWP80_01565 [Candidatus Gracilibacteria bacterium]|nr:hypothetical protein [Candidatus Gracilibacteria bacterium]
MDENNQLTYQEVDEIVMELLKKHLEEIELDVEKFLDLLKNSLSLSISEKKRVIDAVPELSQFQFNELIKVFEEERVKFRELSSEHPEDITKLYSKQQQEWLTLGEIYQNEMKSEEIKNEDQEKLDEIKKSLGL